MRALFGRGGMAEKEEDWGKKERIPLEECCERQ